MRSRDFLAIAVLVLASGGCTEIDETVVVDVSTMVPSLSDSDLASQRVEVGVLPGEGTIQNVYFDRVELIFLTLDEFETDMTFEAKEHTMLLEVRSLSMTVQRTPPLFLPPGGDFDGDQVANADDNCVLVDNPDQTDTGMKGYGDACAAFDFFQGIALPDSDADRIADSTDNCPYTPNPGQEDAGIDLGDMITVPDGIGDACVTETATVTLNGTTTIELSTGPLTAVLPFRQVRWLTVDIRDEASLSDCWNGGSCELDADEVVLCLDETGGFGCN
jgi:hypothetical protein